MKDKNSNRVQLHTPLTASTRELLPAAGYVSSLPTDETGETSISTRLSTYHGNARQGKYRLRTA